MSRKLPEFAPGNFYHIYNRGVEGNSIFVEHRNYIYVLNKFEQYSRKNNITIIAYCLMPTHYHLLVRQDGDIRAGLLPQRTFNSYTKAFNRRFDRSGTLFEGPYRAKLIDSDEYLLHLCRYIHANPVKDGLCSAPEEWEFSNYREWIGLRDGTLVDNDFVRAHYPTPGKYTEFVNGYLANKEPTALQHGGAWHLNLKQQIKRRAAELGFALCSVTTPDAPPHQEEYAQWLVDDMHGEMGYLATERARERRADPRTILPECESILTLAVNYFQGEWPHTSEEHTGRVARYAWNDDYHDVLLERLQELVEFIATEAGRPIAHKIYTDTGPLLERELAQRAGLGWIGKNTNLINTRIGSWLLLAEVLLDVSLPPDKPIKIDHCGTCTACIEACPTDAILTDPRRVDSRRCISYLTIETKGEIEIDMRAGVGDWVFGCDICQDVCPWNVRFAEANLDPAFAPRMPLPNPELTALLAMSQEEFSRTFQSSPVKRTKRRGLLRNASVALGNSGDVTAVPALAEALTADAEPVVRAHAAWALGEIASLQAREALSRARKKESDPKVMSEIEAALERFEPG